MKNFKKTYTKFIAALDPISLEAKSHRLILSRYMWHDAVNYHHAYKADLANNELLLTVTNKYKALLTLLGQASENDEQIIRIIETQMLQHETLHAAYQHNPAIKGLNRLIASCKRKKPTRRIPPRKQQPPIVTVRKADI